MSSPGWSSRCATHATPVQLPGGRGGHVRHRRRRRRDLQHLHRRGTGRRRCRVSGGQARQPRGVIAVRQRRRPRGARGRDLPLAGRAFAVASTRPASASCSRPIFIRRCATSPRFAASSGFERCSTCSARSRIPPGSGTNRSGFRTPDLDAHDGRGAPSTGTRPRARVHRTGRRRRARRRRTRAMLRGDRRRRSRFHPRPARRRPRGRTARCSARWRRGNQRRDHPIRPRR